MIPQLRKRVHAIERHLSPTGPCLTCRGKGHLVTRWIDFPPERGGDSRTERGSPCPRCGKAIVVEVVMTYQITPKLEQARIT